MAELRELDKVSSDREDLSAQVVALRDKLADQREERGQVEHFRLVGEERGLAQSRGALENMHEHLTREFA